MKFTSMTRHWQVWSLRLFLIYRRKNIEYWPVMGSFPYALFPPASSPYPSHMSVLIPVLTKYLQSKCTDSQTAIIESGPPIHKPTHSWWQTYIKTLNTCDENWSTKFILVRLWWSVSVQMLGKMTSSWFGSLINGGPLSRNKNDDNNKPDSNKFKRTIILGQKRQSLQTSHVQINVDKQGKDLQHKCFRKLVLILIAPNPMA